MSPWWKEKGATTTIPKMMPRQHIGSGNSLRDRCKRKDGVSESNEMKGGAIPLPGSHESVTRQPRNNKRDETDTVLTRETFHTTQASITRVIVSGYTFETLVSGRFEIVEEGVVLGSRTRVVEEVAVHVAVVVLGRR